MSKLGTPRNQHFEQYVVYMPHEPATISETIHLSQNAGVNDLAKAVIDHAQFKQVLKRDLPYFFQCDNFPQNPRETLYSRALEWVRNHCSKWEATSMTPLHRLHRYFPNGPAPKEDEKIDIICVNKAILQRYDVFYAFTMRYASKVASDRASLIRRMRMLPDPAVGLADEKSIARWINMDGLIHPHWPTGNYGPATSLFHPTLARLQHHLTHLDEIEEPSVVYLDLSSKFIAAIGEKYDSKWSRMLAIREIINELIGQDVEWIAGSEAEVTARSPDAVWKWNNIVGTMLHIQNMDGVEKYATFQALLSYAKTLAGELSYEYCIYESNLPVILLSFTGSRFEISTAIFTDGIYLDTIFSRDLIVDEWQSDTTLAVSRIFKVLYLSIAELRHYYQGLSLRIWGGMNPTTKCMFPNPLPAAPGHPIPQLRYIGKLTRSGALLNPNYRDAVKRERPFALYWAKLVKEEYEEEIDVVVKFTVHYYVEAHRLLAKHHLAPTYIAVFLCSVAYNGRIYRDVETAISLLHSKDLVFGDLCVENIIPKPDGGAVLVDFDWVGSDGLDRYPTCWTTRDIVAPGVERRALMKKEHDLFMLEELRNWLNIPESC
ncbi:hypothetical protein ABKN59_005664 [Abortiporus biennis]